MCYKTPRCPLGPGYGPWGLRLGLHSALESLEAGGCCRSFSGVWNKAIPNNCPARLCRSYCSTGYRQRAGSCPTNNWVTQVVWALLVSIWYVWGFIGTALFRAARGQGVLGVTSSHLSSDPQEHWAVKSCHSCISPLPSPLTRGCPCLKTLCFPCWQRCQELLQGSLTH